jgi:hypothetical protein
VSSCYLDHTISSCTSLIPLLRLVHTQSIAPSSSLLLRFILPSSPWHILTFRFLLSLFCSPPPPPYYAPNCSHMHLLHAPAPPTLTPSPPSSSCTPIIHQNEQRRLLPCPTLHQLRIVHKYSCRCIYYLGESLFSLSSPASIPLP